MSDPDPDRNSHFQSHIRMHKKQRHRPGPNADPREPTYEDNPFLSHPATVPTSTTEVSLPILLSQVSTKAFDTETIIASSSHSIPTVQKTSGSQDPTIVQEEGLEFIGEPMDLYSVTPSMMEESIEENRRKVTVNIRRKKMIVWLLIHAFLLTWTAFSDVIQKLYLENEKVFSMHTLKPWLMPFVIAEMALSGLVLLTFIVKMMVLKDKCVATFYNYVVNVNNIQYLLALLALPFGMYFMFSDLSKDMKKEIEENAKPIEGIGINWNSTQVERQCCGFDSRHDWNNASDPEIFDTPKDLELEIKEDVLRNGDITYPTTCCNTTALKRGQLCTESSGKYWKDGCHNKEFAVLMDYLMIIIGLVIVSLILAIVIKLRVTKLEHYLSIFRPVEMS